MTLLSQVDAAVFGSTPATAGLLSGVMIGVHLVLGFEISVIILLVIIALGVFYP